MIEPGGLYYIVSQANPTLAIGLPRQEVGSDITLIPIVKTAGERIENPDKVLWKCNADRRFSHVFSSNVCVIDYEFDERILRKPLFAGRYDTARDTQTWDSNRRPSMILSIPHPVWCIGVEGAKAVDGARLISEPISANPPQEWLFVRVNGADYAVPGG